MNEQINATRIEQTIRLSRATIEMILGLDMNAKALMTLGSDNVEEANRDMLDVIERKVKNVIESKLS